MLYKMIYFRSHMTPTQALLRPINSRVSLEDQIFCSVTLLARDSILYFLLIFGMFRTPIPAREHAKLMCWFWMTDGLVMALVPGVIAAPFDLTL